MQNIDDATDELVLLDDTDTTPYPLLFVACNKYLCIIFIVHVIGLNL